MNLLDIKKDITNIYDLSPEWMEGLKYNPIREIINKGKSYHLINLLFNIFGSVKTNPIIKSINSKHYKQQDIISTLTDIKSFKRRLSINSKNSLDHCMDILTLIAKIDYFCVHYKSLTDNLIRDIIKYSYFDSPKNMNYQSKFIFYLIKLGYKNIYIEKALKKMGSFQNNDGGWSVSCSLKNEKSDIFTTLLVHRCFLENSLWRNKSFLKKSESFLIKNYISDKNTPEELDRWSRIYIGYRKNNLFEGGTILLLESLLISETRSKNVKTILKWLKTLQLKNGFFPYHVKLKNQPNFTSTINILSLFKKSYLINNT